MLTDGVYLVITGLSILFSLAVGYSFAARDFRARAIERGFMRAVGSQGEISFEWVEFPQKIYDNNIIEKIEKP